MGSIEEMWLNVLLIHINRSQKNNLKQAFFIIIENSFTALYFSGNPFLGGHFLEQNMSELDIFP